MLREVTEATKSIRKNIRAFRSKVNAGEEVFQKTFKPIIEPFREAAGVVKHRKAQSPELLLKQKPEPGKQKLDVLKQNALSPAAKREKARVRGEEEKRFFEAKEEEGNIHPKVFEYLKNLSETPQHFNTQYGPHLGDDGQPKMGNADIRFDLKSIKLMRGGNIIGQYTIIPELLNVLFSNTSPRDVSTKTKKTYAEILNVTNAIRKKYDGNSGIQGTRSQKYSTFIKPILEEYNLLLKAATASTTHLRSARKGEEYSEYLSSRVDYRYWDSAKELLDRLRLLWASQQIGNNFHHNKIVAILEELRKAGVIY